MWRYFDACTYLCVLSGIEPSGVLALHDKVGMYAISRYFDNGHYWYGVAQQRSTELVAWVISALALSCAWHAQQHAVRGRSMDASSPATTCPDVLPPSFWTSFINVLDSLHSTELSFFDFLLLTFIQQYIHLSPLCIKAPKHWRSSVY